MPIRKVNGRPTSVGESSLKRDAQDARLAVGNSVAKSYLVGQSTKVKLIVVSPNLVIKEYISLAGHYQNY